MMVNDGASPDEAVKRPDNEAVSAVESAPEGPKPAPDAPVTASRPIDSRFLYVDVAAQRAKQLRRGARPRLDDVPEADLDQTRWGGQRLKLERIAMREVDAGKITYEVPADGDEPAKAN